MLRAVSVILICLSISAFSQSTEKYKSDYERFYKAEDLYEKGKFSAAEKEFNLFIKEYNEANDPLFIKANYYAALSALKLYHGDAEILLLTFLKNYPESIYQEQVYLELGRFYYRKKKFDKTIEWLLKIDPYNLVKDYRDEYYFKLGYAYFREDQLKNARDAFFEIVHSPSPYQSPALYYYSHIAYTEKSYETALEGFRNLENDPNFSETVPYYIAQIYYLQGKYDKLLEYAPTILDSSDAKNANQMSHLIGDAFYKVGKYDEAVPFLEEYNRKSETTRDEDYQLGYAYYKSGIYDKAIRTFSKVSSIEDELGQIAHYHIGECYLQQENYLYARSAFEKASTLPFDKAVEEDALYNYAVLSYKLDFNPFDEAVEALNLYLTRYPNSKRNQDVYQFLVNVYTTMKNYKSAIESIDRIKDKDFKMKNAYQIMAYNYGVELFQNGENDQSIDNFKLVKRYPIDPKLNALSYYWIAEAYFKMTAYEDAITWYKSFIAEPGSYGLNQHNDAYYNIAYCYFKQGKYDLAIQSFRTFTQDTKEVHKEKITDAYLRIGDAYFVKPKVDGNNDDDNAILYYNKAIETGGGQLDYAKYQVGLTYGFKGNYVAKAKSMLDIVNNYNKSTFAIPALFEAGESYRLMNNSDDSDHYAKAKKYYNQLIKDHPNHAKVVDAIFQIGMLSFISKDYAAAEAQFLKIINEYDNKEKEKEALSRLEDIYTATNKPQKYLDLLDKIGVVYNKSYEDSITYESAYRSYEDSLFSDAAASFKVYLKNFSPPQNELNALYYMAVSYQKTGNEVEAILAYKSILSKSTNKYTERAANIASEHEYNQRNYQLAIEYYQKLAKVATYPENRLKAQIGLMRCFTFENELSAAREYAKLVLKDPLALDVAITEAHYVIGKAELELNNYDLALKEFRIVTKTTVSMIGAESQYNIAFIFNQQEEYKKSEDEVRLLMKNYTGYDYWLAKGLIIQAKNSIGLDDFVTAEYTLNSVLSGYSNKTDGILEEANVVMREVLAIKNQGKDIQPQNNNTIEIGDGND
ncbi:tetratricopeptide repeat protein [Crocinitomix catalasitica]|uniref:tetratricopeptide repeat protein n=1 Tax=Crocinitomix catalasitica TaxID=184607 RepID=UPI000485E033|nr:tetratricopeptide repeat protein [Crocinitomix catalasitica]